MIKSIQVSNNHSQLYNLHPLNCIVLLRKEQIYPQLDKNKPIKVP